MAGREEVLLASPPPRLVPPPVGLSVGQRAAAVVEVIGHPVAGQARFNPVLADLVEASWQHTVAPVLRQAWPAVFALPYRQKLRAGFETYSSLGLSLLVCSRRRPWWVRLGSAACRWGHLGEATMARWGVWLLPWAYRVLLQGEVQRVALMSALILVLDEALDDALTDLPVAERPGALRAVMEGQRAVGPGVLGAVDALCRAVRSGCRHAEDRTRLQQAFTATHRWAQEETDNLQGVPDPSGLCHRRIGITTSMDLLAWGVADAVGDLEREWLYRVAELGQMVDDWLDWEKDARHGRVTPAILGTWTLASIRGAFACTQEMLQEMAHAGGETYAPYVELVQRTYVTQIQRMVQILVNHP